MTLRLRAPLLLLAVTVGCHTDPFPLPFPAGTAFYGANGPLHPGPEERLTWADTNEDGNALQAYTPTWAYGGRGILFSFSPRPYGPGERKTGFRCVLSATCRTVAADPLDTCIAMLPPIGGSAYFDACESRSTHSGTTDILATGDLNGGQLLYTEMSGINYYADLWLAAPGDTVHRHDLCRLLDNTGGGSLPSAPPCGVSGGSLADIQWSGVNTFVALGGGGGLYRGTITNGTANLTAVPGTGAATQYSLVDGNLGAMFIGADLSVRHVTLGDGTVSVAGVLPLSTQGQLLDVGCHPDVCIILTSDGAPTRWDLWRLDIATRNVLLVRTFSHPLSSAKLSPVSGDVVALEGANVYLLTDVVP